MDERERQVEAALHPAGVGAHPAVGGEREADALEQLVAARGALLARDAVERGLEAQVVAAGEERVERGLLERGADRARTFGPSLTTSKPATVALPAVGGRSVVSMWTVVDLPAPFGPRKP